MIAPTAPALPNFCTRTAFSVWNIIQIGSIAASSLISLSVTYIIEKIVAFVNWLFYWESSDKNHLVLSRTRIPTIYQEWYRNFALMQDIYIHTENPEIKELTKFLISNHLNPNTDMNILAMKLRGLSLGVTDFHHLTPLPTHRYHRNILSYDVHTAAKYNKQLVMSENSPLIPIDTRAISELFPLYFSILDPSNPAAWADSLTKVLENHFTSHNLNQSLDMDILLDTSLFLSDYIHKESKALFEQEYARLKTQLHQAIATVVARFPQCDKKKLKAFLQKHITGVVHFDMNEFSGIKVLPLFQKNEASDFSVTHARFKDFIICTGGFIGGIATRRYLIDPFQNHTDVRLGTKGPRPSQNIPLQLIHETQLFSTLTERFARHTNRAVKNLGEATLKLIKGLESKVDYKAIDPEKRELLAQTLFMLFIHLADANDNIDRAFHKFANAIRLTHYDLQALLAITTPYQSSDFAPIYLENVPKLPKCKATAGLAKSAMNIFSAINTVLLRDPEIPRKPVRAYANEIYFEEVHLLKEGTNGKSCLLDTALNDPSIEKIDLFTCQFNPNLCIASDFTHYKAGHVIEDIHEIFAKKPATDKLTVAVDWTIDYSDSEAAKELLIEFKDEIESGRICFIFFRSGQKFDMLGMDNYFGAPYAIFHNRSDRWSHFTFLSESPALQTDPLSLQWFCLSNEFIPKELNEYRGLIFQNTRTAVQGLPNYLHNPKALLRVNTFDDRMNGCFIDIKLRGPFHNFRTSLIMADLYRYFLKNKVSIISRGSFGFQHTNAFVIRFNAVSNSTTIRINPGANPDDAQLLRKFLENLRYRL